MSIDQVENVSESKKILDRYLAAYTQQDVLKFITCGSVDDGKSTLIGRLLFESKSIYDDQIEDLAKVSQKFGTQDSSIDFALLVDGLSSEREQGITIDVAYRFFRTQKRSFIVADTPGHVQYTRNMVTGASNADLGILLVDARQSVLSQTKRHLYICTLLGIKQIVVAVNKMDLVDYSEAVFNSIQSDILSLIPTLNVDLELTTIPLSALNGDNITELSDKMLWYKGPTLLGHLEQVSIESEDHSKPMCMPIQWVNRPHSNFRGVSGTLCSGTVHKGSEVTILPSLRNAKISKIVTANGELDFAQKGQSVTLVFDSEIDASRGDVVVTSTHNLKTTNKFSATLVWMSDTKKLICEKSYFLKIGTSRVNAVISKLHNCVSTDSYAKYDKDQLCLNDIGDVEISVLHELPIQKYSDNKTLGSFILIDRHTFDTLAAGMVTDTLNGLQNIHYHNTMVTRSLRESIKPNKGLVLWFTGLSASGKSTLANRLEQYLNSIGVHTYLLDGDNMRSGLCKDLNFTEQDRIENIRRVSEIAKLMVDAGLVVLVASISPYISSRKAARDLFDKDSYHEIHIDCPLDTLISRDPKGLYKKAQSGEIKNFTGVSHPYEAPKNPHVYIDTSEMHLEDCVSKLVTYANSVIF